MCAQATTAPTKLGIVLYSKMSRLFTFGCSFTDYEWPTWADIIGQEFDYYENWARGGMGNQYIFNSLIECNKRNKFTSDDTIMIMWSTVLREDRYIANFGGWIGTGNIWKSEAYTTAWKKKFICERGFLIRDLALISAAQDLLKYWQVRYNMSSLLPIETDDKDVLNLYKTVLDDIASSFVGTIDILGHLSCRDFFNEEIKANQDLLNDLEDEYNQCKGADWPTFKIFLKQKNIEKIIVDDINNYRLYDKLFNLTYKYADHPTPKEHMLYVQKIFPNYVISENTKNWINNYKFGDEFIRHFPKYRF